MKNLLFIICILFSAQSLFGQEITVTGTVTDETGPMIGVTVVVEGTQMGTITDIDGNYSLDVPSSESVLQFSFIGFRTVSEVVGNRTTINVTMDENVQGLDEVVVIG
ncbi:MAG TPA: carboxypeptidase-like regulatory domain-containing protein [Draconibacterium sp.]|nr:carboxypeptidase-like regulatory domain-containing protein [Draconibacterium sp.]